MSYGSVPEVVWAFAGMDLDSMAPPGSPRFWRGMSFSANGRDAAKVSANPLVLRIAVAACARCTARTPTVAWCAVSPSRSASQFNCCVSPIPVFRSPPSHIAAWT